MRRTVSSRRPRPRRPSSTRKRRSTRRRRMRGGIGETIREWLGIPVSENALMTNSKGIIRRVKEIESPLSRSNTQGLPGDDDI